MKEHSKAAPGCAVALGRSMAPARAASLAAAVAAAAVVATAALIATRAQAEQATLIPVVPLAWQTIAPGAARATLGARNDGDDQSVIQLFRFELSHFRPEVIVGDGKPPRGHTAAELVHLRGAAAAVNGGFFDQRVSPLGLRIAAGITRSPLKMKSDWGVLSFTQSGRAHIRHTRDFAASQSTAAPEGSEKIRDAIQVGPRLVVDGAPLKLKPQYARRTAVALDREGLTLTLVIVDTPIDANDLASQLAQHGFDTAMMLDGGPSTQLAVAIGAEKVDVRGGYPVPDLLALFARRAPVSLSPALAPGTPKSAMGDHPSHQISPEKKGSASPTPGTPLTAPSGPP